MKKIKLKSLYDLIKEELASDEDEEYNNIRKGIPPPPPAEFDKYKGSDIDTDELIKKGHVLVPSTPDSETGRIDSIVVNLDDFPKMLKTLYSVYYEMQKYKTSSDPKVSRLAALIAKDITYTIQDIKLLDSRIKLIKKGLK